MFYKPLSFYIDNVYYFVYLLLVNNSIQPTQAMLIFDIKAFDKYLKILSANKYGGNSNLRRLILETLPLQYGPQQYFNIRRDMTQHPTIQIPKLIAELIRALDIPKYKFMEFITENPQETP